MNKITTEDCKNFIVQEITKNSDIIHDIFGDKTTAIKKALIKDNWIRTAKFSPVGKHNYVQEKYGLWSTTYGKSGGFILGTQLRAVRVLNLSPDEFEDAVSFMILEDNQGNLLLGEYVGD